MATRALRSWPARCGVLAVSAAIAAAVIYLPQPMLVELAASFGISPQAAGVVATAVQAGYAAGIFLLVPLTERVQPRRQITLQALALAAALLVTAVLPDVVAVAAGFVVVGLVANIAQLIIPTAGKLAPEDRRGATTATLVGALLCGIFGGRVVAGVLVEPLGWRWVLVLFAGLVLATVPLLRTALADDLELSAAGSSYGALLWSALRLVRSSRSLVLAAATQFFTFATFNSLWTVMPLHLTGEAHQWSPLAAGLFGLVGLAAGLVTPLGGRLVDRFGARPVVGAAAGLILAGCVATIFDADLLWLFTVSIFIVTWANQTMQAANQNQILVTNPGTAGQANTMFMVFVFLGGSFGALAGPIAYGLGGMRGVAVEGTAFVAVSLAIWLVALLADRRGTTRMPAVRHSH
ncbi:MFS transporter [Amycolatopsis sp. Hca4]|uniref:MFS transporter n=1 Tax=Amycolatopsis sp. Hca4 TaxID=2742131 RepID=UPI0015913620|nr:MFS transporter [Amycolatopsis sp. Hca4]QKV75815.1 MFS transporter [Amycolatopsis sp. Hca4]